MNKFFYTRLLLTFGASLLIGATQGCGQVQGIPQEQCYDCNGGLGIPGMKVLVRTIETNAVVNRELSLKAIEFGNRAFRLELSSGNVFKIGSQTPIYHLNASELVNLTAIFVGSIVSSSVDLSPSPNILACTSDYRFGYATLITDQESLAVGSGSSSCPVDLYKIQTRNTAGLREFLEAISSKMSRI